MKKGTKAGRGPSDVDRVIGQKVRDRRILLGLSQEKLADGLGITFQQVQKYERGSNRISAGRLYAIAQALEVDIAWFFEGLDQPHAGVAGDLDDRAVKAAGLFQAIEDRVLQDHAMAILRALAKSTGPALQEAA